MSRSRQGAPGDQPLGRLFQQRHFGGRLHGAGEHHRVIGIRRRDPVQIQPVGEIQVVETDAGLGQFQRVYGVDQNRLHVEAKGFPCGSCPRLAFRLPRDEAVDVGHVRRQVQRHHHGPEGADILDPGVHVDEGGEVIVGQDQDGVVRRVPRQHQRIGPWFVRFMRDRIEAGQVVDVQRLGDHQAIQIAGLHRMPKPVQVAEFSAARLRSPVPCANHL